MVSEESSTLTAETPGDLLAVIPYLLGYHPTESIVLVLLNEQSIRLCARMDLHSDVDRATGSARTTADRFAEVARANHASGAILIAYSADRGLAESFLQSATARLAASAAVVDALYADGQRWWSTLCDRECCPAEGVEYLTDSSRICAEAVYAGLSAAPSRTEIVQQVSGPPAEDGDRLRRLAVSVAQEVFAYPPTSRETWIRSLVDDCVRRRHDDPGRHLSDTVRLRLACLAADVSVRDQAWAMMRRSNAEFHAELWQQVVERSVAPFEAAPLCLLGMAAWISGQGTLQVCCVERVQAVDPDYSMGDLLAEINQRAMPPQLWDEMQPAVAEQTSEQDQGGGCQ